MAHVPLMGHGPHRKPKNREGLRQHGDLTNLLIKFKGDTQTESKVIS
jgi:hypothetical protein